MQQRVRALLFFALLIAGGLSWRPAHAQQHVRRNVEVEWDGIDGATLYEIQITSKENVKAKPLRFKLTQPKWTANIKPGLYSMKLRSYDDRGVPGDWGPASDLEVKLPAIIALSPTPSAVVQARNDSTEEVTLKWEPIPGAEKYRVNVNSTTNEWKRQTDVRDTSVSFNLPVGQLIEWNVSAIDDKGNSGEVSADNYKFELKGPPIKRPKIQKPMSKFVKEVSWSPSQFATDYSYELKYFNAQSRKWELVETKEKYAETSVKLDISRPSGKYRMVVQSHSAHREASPKVQMDFQMRGGFRDPAALETAILRDSISKPTNYYAIASYLVTKIDYASKNQETNTAPKFGAIGGTGRIGLGYQDPESKWGGFGIIDLSGFIINGQNFKFASVELHATRKIELGQKGVLLFATGVFSKELPIVKGTNVNGFDGVGKVRNLGPHAGFIYWLPLNDRFGLQANARAYYTLTGSTTTNAKASPSLSYQYGLLGSYRLQKEWMGYAGYAFRHDEAVFDAISNSQDRSSFATPGSKNEISIEGHYLNLILEYSF